MNIASFPWVPPGRQTTGESQQLVPRSISHFPALAAIDLWRAQCHQTLCGTCQLQQWWHSALGEGGQRDRRVAMVFSGRSQGQLMLWARPLFTWHFSQRRLLMLHSPQQKADCTVLFCSISYVDLVTLQQFPVRYVSTRLSIRDLLTLFFPWPHPIFPQKGGRQRGK